MGRFKYTPEEHRRRLDALLEEPSKDEAFWDAVMVEADAAGRAMREAGRRSEDVTADDLRVRLR